MKKLTILTASTLLLVGALSGCSANANYEEITEPIVEDNSEVV